MGGIHGKSAASDAGISTSSVSIENTLQKVSIFNFFAMQFAYEVDRAWGASRTDMMSALEGGGVSWKSRHRKGGCLSFIV